ncbi:unnamed protein product [Brachionus calyciflorus]|uniref:Sulphur transport domain-containing protein n=1 Tax=Brachionus calyciflorus TaxID=104777 RepID=A0A813TT37_9BILA|nr:unnamed protein product [Brachionus calyciflorus]
MTDNTNSNVKIEIEENLEENEKNKKILGFDRTKIKSLLMDILIIVVMCLIGFLFGFILEKCKVYEPKFIRQQMIFNKFLMMKMFCSALATSMLSILILNFIAKNRFLKVFESYRDMLKPKSLLIVSAGGLILGLGMTIAGSCPGMIFVQLGAGVNYSYLTLIGGLLAAFTHGLLNSYLTSTSKSDPIASKTIFEIVKINQIIVRIVMILLLGVAIAVMEIVIPWKKDYKFRNETKPFFSVTSEVWHPILAGCLLGSLQFFSLLILSKSLGSSSSFSTVVSFVFPSKILEKFPYLKKFRFGLQNYISIIFVLSVFVGSMVSAFLGDVFNKAENVHPYNALIGGFLLVFGARLAGGCNTGHGISGTSHLFFGSIVAMMSMFASGIAIGFFAHTNEFFF